MLFYLDTHVGRPAISLFAASWAEDVEVLVDVTRLAWSDDKSEISAAFWHE